jgi:hypothetical protein
MGSGGLSHGACPSLQRSGVLEAQHDRTWLVVTIAQALAEHRQKLFQWF